MRLFVHRAEAEINPTGISFVGKLYDEGTLLRIAQFYQDHTAHEEVHPKPFL